MTRKVRARKDNTVCFILAFQTSYPEERLVKSQVEAISCMRKTWGLFQTGVGMREKAYGPAKGGRVTGLYATAGPRSGFTTGRPGAGMGRNGVRFCAIKPMPRSDPEIQHKHVETKRQLWKTVLLGEPK